MAVFLACLFLGTALPVSEVTVQALRVALPSMAVLVFSRGALVFRLRGAWSSVGLGIAVFLIWIAPDLLFPGYRHHWLFENSVLGYARASLPESARSVRAVVTLRVIRAVLVVPVVEELFWRAWLMRWLISPHFNDVPLGAYKASAFWICAILFASEHGSYWDVGLAAGILYNWWVVRTRSLGDLILAHAVTNACLSAYVILAGKWEYWL